MNKALTPTLLNQPLPHVGRDKVRNAHNRAQYIERRKPMMDWWSEHIEKAATGNMSLTGVAGLSLVNGL